MEEMRQTQVEALEVFSDFNVRVVGSMRCLIDELSGERRADTDELLHSVTDAINWEIQVINGTLSLLNEDKQRVDAEQFNLKVIALSDALKVKDEPAVIDALNDLIPAFENLGLAAKDVLAV